MTGSFSKTHSSPTWPSPVIGRAGGHGEDLAEGGPGDGRSHLRAVVGQEVRKRRPTPLMAPSAIAMPISVDITFLVTDLMSWNSQVEVP